MRFWGKLGALLALMLLSAALIAACSDDDEDDDGGEATATATETAMATEENGDDGGNGDGAAVAVALTEWEVTPAATSASGGAVTFTVTNDGAVPHELAVVRTDEAADALPTDNGLVDEGAVEVLGRTAQLLGGESADLTVDLDAGSYVLLCNIAGHYDLGMRSAFTVE